MNKSLLALYGLKWNPFSQELPTEALMLSPKAKDFFWRIEQAHVREGGFALITGDPGTGKSVILRLLARAPGAFAGPDRRRTEPPAEQSGRLLPRTRRDLQRRAKTP